MLRSVLLAVSSAALLLCAQASADPVATDTPSGWAVLPGLSYNPDNGLRVAATALVFSRSSAANPRVSQLAGSFELSVRGDRELVLAPNIWLSDARFNVAFKLRANQITRPYFGIGNDTPFSARENYQSTRLGLRGHVNYRIIDDLFLGVVYDLQFQKFTDYEPGKAVERFVLDEGLTTFDSGAGVELRPGSLRAGGRGGLRSRSRCHRKSGAARARSHP